MLRDACEQSLLRNVKSSTRYFTYLVKDMVCQVNVTYVMTITLTIYLPLSIICTLPIGLLNQFPFVQAVNYAVGVVSTPKLINFVDQRVPADSYSSFAPIKYSGKYYSIPSLSYLKHTNYSPLVRVISITAVQVSGSNIDGGVVPCVWSVLLYNSYCCVCDTITKANWQLVDRAAVTHLHNTPYCQHYIRLLFLYVCDLIDLRHRRKQVGVSPPGPTYTLIRIMTWPDICQRVETLSRNQMTRQNCWSVMSISIMEQYQMMVKVWPYLLTILALTDSLVVCIQVWGIVLFSEVEELYRNLELTLVDIYRHRVLERAQKKWYKQILTSVWPCTLQFPQNRLCMHVDLIM